MKRCGVYTITNTINNKIYVGSTTRLFCQRWGDHRVQLRSNKHHNIHLQRAWNKYGEDSLDFIILTTCGEHQLLKKEAEFIKKYNSLDATYGYNLTIPVVVSTRNISK